MCLIPSIFPLISLAVIYVTLHLNFTATLNVSSNQMSNVCYTITFSWTLPSSWTAEMLGGTEQILLKSSISYESLLNQSGVISLEVNITEFVLYSSESDFLPATLYTFWLNFEVDFLNGTLGQVRSFPANETTPSCGGESNEYIWFALLSFFRRWGPHLSVFLCVFSFT